MAADIEPRQAELRGNADEDRWVFWSSQAALFGLMTLGMTVLILTLGDGTFPPGHRGGGLVVVRMAGFAVLFGILGWIYTQPWFQRLPAAIFGIGIVGACIAMTLLDMVVFPLVLRSTMPRYLLILERYPVPAVVNRFTFCILWSALFSCFGSGRRFAWPRRQADRQCTASHRPCLTSTLHRSATPPSCPCQRAGRPL